MTNARRARSHVDDSMAGTYTHLQPEDLISLVEKLSEEAGSKGRGDGTEVWTVRHASAPGFRAAGLALCHGK